MKNRSLGSVSRPHQLPPLATVLLVGIIAFTGYQFAFGETADGARRPLTRSEQAAERIARYEERQRELARRPRHRSSVDNDTGRAAQTEAPLTEEPVARPMLPPCGEQISYGQGIMLGRRRIPDIQCWSRMSARELSRICTYAGRRPRLQNELYTLLCPGSSSRSSGQRVHHSHHRRHRHH